MLKIEAETLESAYSQAAEKLSCSVTQLNIEIIQSPKNGFLGFFKKQAVIVVTCKEEKKSQSVPPQEVKAPVQEKKIEPKTQEKPVKVKEPKTEKKVET